LQEVRVEVAQHEAARAEDGRMTLGGRALGPQFHSGRKGAHDRAKLALGLFSIGLQRDAERGSLARGVHLLQITAG
jgi:hypothetical protein